MRAVSSGRHHGHSLDLYRHKLSALFNLRQAARRKNQVAHILAGAQHGLQNDRRGEHLRGFGSVDWRGGRNGRSGHGKPPRVVGQSFSGRFCQRKSGEPAATHYIKLHYLHSIVEGEPESEVVGVKQRDLPVQGITLADWDLRQN